MTDQITRLKIEFNTAAGDNVVRYYALDAQTLRQAQLWQAEQKTPPSAEQFSDWLSYNGGKLDRADGPALIQTRNDGLRIEVWFCDGKVIKKGTIDNLASIPGVTVLPPQP